MKKYIFFAAIVVLVAVVACNIQKEDQQPIAVAKEGSVSKSVVNVSQHLSNPGHPDNNLKAPNEFEVEFVTGKGSFVVKAHREWAPIGVDRFYNMVKSGYFVDCRFFRMASSGGRKFVAQFGMHGDPKINRAWANKTLMDEPVKKSNLRGYLTYAKTGAPNSRSNQFFINFSDGNRFLDSQGFSAFAQVVKGMDVVDKLNFEYGGRPDQGAITNNGNAYLKAQFPNLDYVIEAKILK